MAHDRIVIDTLRQMDKYGYGLFVACEQRGCDHCVEILADVLIQRFGWEYEITKNRDAFLNRLVCTKCGHRRPHVHLISRGDWEPGAPGQVGGSHGHSATAVNTAGIDYAEALRLAIEFRKAHPPQPTIGKYRKRRRRR